MKSRTKYVLASIIILLLVLTYLVYAYTPGNIYLNGGLPSTASYIIETDGAGNYRTIRYDGYTYDAASLVDAENNVIAGLPSGGSVYLREVQWNLAVAIPNNLFVLESYQGRYKTYSNFGQLLIPMLAADPLTAGWGANEEGRLWYNTAEKVFRYWNTSESVTLGNGTAPGYSDDDSVYLFLNGTRQLTANWNTGAFGFYGATWMNATSGSFSSLWVNGKPVVPSQEASYIVGQYNSTHYYMQNHTGYGLSVYEGYEYLSSNASAVINNARGNLTNGGLLFAKAGTYTLDSNILLTSDIMFKGEGTGTIIVANGNFNAIRVFGTPTVHKYNVTISDLSLIGSTSILNTLNYGVYMYYVTNCLVERVYTSGFGAPAAIDVGAAIGCTIRNNWVSNASVNGIGLGEGSYYNAIDGNHITNTTQFNGIDLNGVADRCDYNQIRDNIIRDCNVSGICLDSANNNTISGNSIYNCRMGIGLGGSLSSSNCAVEKNYVEGSWGPSSTGHGIHIQTAASIHDDVKGNTLIKNVAMGIILSGAFGEISDNTCWGNGRGIDVYGDNYVIKDNYCINNTAVPNIRNTADRTVLGGNAFEGIVISGTNTVWNSGNTLDYLPCENMSNATVTALSTTVTVTHGLAGTPTTVRITATSDLGGRTVWVSSKGATTFVITISSADLDNNLGFDWEADYVP